MKIIIFFKWLLKYNRIYIFKIFNFYNFISFLNQINEIYLNNSEDELTVVIICFFTVFILVGYVYFRNYKRKGDENEDEDDDYDIFD
jgi:hypothetical protein